MLSQRSQQGGTLYRTPHNVSTFSSICAHSWGLIWKWSMQKASKISVRNPLVAIIATQCVPFGRSPHFRPSLKEPLSATNSCSENQGLKQQRDLLSLGPKAESQNHAHDKTWFRQSSRWITPRRRWNSPQGTEGPSQAGSPTELNQPENRQEAGGCGESFRSVALGGFHNEKRLGLIHRAN